MERINLPAFTGHTIRWACRHLSDDAMSNHAVTFISETGVQIQYPDMYLCKDWHGGKVIAEMAVILHDTDTAQIYVDGTYLQLPESGDNYTFFIRVQEPVLELVFNPLLNLLVGPRPVAAV